MKKVKKLFVKIVISLINTLNKYNALNIIQMLALKLYTENRKIYDNLFELLSEEDKKQLWRNVIWYTPPKQRKKYVMEHPEFPWSWDAVVKCWHDFPIEFIVEHSEKAWDWDEISRYVVKSVKPIIENPHIPWNWENLGICNNTIPIKEMIEHKELHWNWGMISLSRHDIEIDDVANNLNIPWNWMFLSENPCFTIDDIKKHLNLPWIWCYVSRNLRITVDDFTNNPDLPWDYFGLSLNPHMTIDCILNHPDTSKYPWNLLALAQSKSGLWKNNVFHEMPKYRKQLAKEIADIINYDEHYYRMAYNPKRMRSYKSIQELREMQNEYGWTEEEMDKYIT